MNDERFPIDMDAVTREALQRNWRCELTCDGTPFVVTVQASTPADAHTAARLRLAGEPGFTSERATMTACVEAP